MAQSNQQQALTIFSIVNGTFHIDTEAFNSVLDKVGDLPFVLLSINGACREGKSYVLNYFIRYFRSAPGAPDWFDTVLSQQEMFSWRSGRKRETLGINLWSEPFIVTRNGRRVAILLMDCQGLFDDQTTFQENAVIFSLSNLLSSVMIYNVKSHIQENLLQNIQCFSDYARAIAVGENCGDQLPNLLFLVRDFSFLSEFAPGQHTNLSFPRAGLENPQNYWEAIFGDQDTMPRENQIVRSEIYRKFHKISFFILPHPGTQFVMDSTRNLPEKEFRDNLKSFISMLCHSDGVNDHLLTKQVGGIETTGTNFKDYVRVWAEACRNSATSFPPAENVAKTTMIMQNEAAASTAMASFNERFQNFFNSDVEAGSCDLTICLKFDEFLQEAIDVYRRCRRLGDQSVEDEYVEKIRVKCQHQFDTTYLRINNEIRERRRAESEREAERAQNAERISGLYDEIEATREQNELRLQRLLEAHQVDDENHQREIQRLIDQMENLRTQGRDSEALQTQLQQMTDAQIRRDDAHRQEMEILGESIRQLANRPIQVVTQPSGCCMV